MKGDSFASQLVVHVTAYIYQQSKSYGGLVSSSARTQSHSYALSLVLNNVLYIADDQYVGSYAISGKNEGYDKMTMMTIVTML